MKTIYLSFYVFMCVCDRETEKRKGGQTDNTFPASLKVAPRIVNETLGLGLRFQNMVMLQEEEC